MNHSLGKDSVANEFIRLNSEIHRDKSIQIFQAKGLSITLFPDGIFPLNVSVENFDEFEYVLFWKDKTEFYEVQRMLNRVFYINLLRSAVIMDAIKSDLIDSKDSCYKHTTLLMIAFQSQVFSQS